MDDKTKTAHARYGGIGSPVSGARRIIVDRCPYCGKTHTHLEGGETNQRMADCFQGEYVLVFEEENNER